MKVDVGVAFMVPQALGLALLNGWAPQPTTVRPESPSFALEMHLPDNCGWSDRTRETRVETHTESAWLIPSWRD
jgi:hypothetical protein